MLRNYLFQSSDTGFLPSVSSKGKEKYWAEDKYVPVIFKPHGLLEGSDQIIWIHIGTQNPENCIAEYQISYQLVNELAVQEPNIISTKEQIDSLRKVMGLNISDIAAILHVSRPTIYEWVESEVSVRSRHQERLNDIYDICLFWGKKKVGCLNAYLYKKPNNASKSLIMMLTEKKLDKNNLHYILNQIEQLILAKKDRKNNTEKLLKQHDFEETSEEELEKNFNANIQTIG